MATQKITAYTTTHIHAALNEASLALGKAWGLAERFCDLAEGGRDPLDTEGILRSVCHQLSSAAGLVQGIEGPNLAVREALAVCGLVMADAQGNCSYGFDSASMWALEALPGAVQRAKESVDAAYPSVRISPSTMIGEAVHNEKHPTDFDASVCAATPAL